MSVAVVHALSMNYYKRPVAVTNDGAVTINNAESFTFRNLRRATAYQINWGDNTPLSSVTSDASGVVTTTHSYAVAGTYTILVRSADNTTTIGSTTVTVA